MLRFAVAAVALCVMASAAAETPLFVADIDCGLERARDENRTNDDLEACAASESPAALAELGFLYWGASASPSTEPSLRGLSDDLTQSQLQAEGRRLLEAAAAAGHPGAPNELGAASLDGEYGMPIDEAAAFRWLSMASERGDIIAPFNLARMYFSGRGVAQSNEQGEAFLRLSVERGYDPARCSLARWLSQYANRESEIAALTRGRRCWPHDIMRELPLIDTDETL